MRNTMKNHFLIVPFFIITAIFTNCNQSPDSEMAYVAGEMESIPESITEENTDIDNRKLIREGWIEFETDQIDSARNRINLAVKKYNAYISNEREGLEYDRFSVQLAIRIPSKNFDAFLSEATRGVEKFDDKHISVKDVTEEFLDQEARLKTKKELENRYLQLLDKAKTVKEILEIEKELATLRADIESAEGRLKYLSNQVSFSTLQVRFYKLIPEETSYGNKFSDGFINGWNNLVLFFIGLINIWPFILLIITGIVLYKYIKRAKS